MSTVTCKHCDQTFEAIADVTRCPHCQKDVAADDLSTLRVDRPAPVAPDFVSSADSAKTAIAGSAQIPSKSIEEIYVGGSSRTLESAGRSPNVADYSASLKPTDSAFDSVDLSSAIPPRAIATSDAAPGEAKDYRLGVKLGSGSFGVVYQAEQIPLQRTVALKMLKPRKRPKDTESDETKARVKSQRVKDRNEFLREAQFTGKLEHPNIVPVHDIGLIKDNQGIGNRPFYVMKEIKGDSWQSKINQNTRTENLEILRRVAEAIDYAHDKNILHCDLKPENVMLGEFGEVLVVDWGQAVDISRPETYRPGGSPAYISPEMARYWCDIYLDEKEASLASQQIGKHSDVYLLGAMLFEIITGRPPHFGIKGETSFDVMRRATENQICSHDDWLEDELMHIARQALRLDASVSFDTVAEFQTALKEYETRRVSIELRDRAMELLEEAKADNDYDAFGKARFGFEESIEKWEDNVQAKHGLSDARLSCAELALKDQNFDLGIGMLEDPENTQEVTLRKKLVNERTKRDRRKRLIGFLSVLLLCGGIGSIGLIGWAAKKTNDAIAAQAVAEVEKASAKIAKKAADDANVIALVAEQDAVEAKAEAATARSEAVQLNASNQELKDSSRDAQVEFNAKKKMFAGQIKLEQDKVEEQVELATQATERAAQQSEKAETQRKEAERQAQIASEAKQRNKLLKYKDSIVQIQSSIRDGDYATARERLLAADDESKNSIEWARLKMLTHPESSEFLTQGAPILHASASHNGQRIVLVEPDSVTIRDVKDFQQVVQQIPIKGASVAALSADGTSLAIGVPGIDGGNGKIILFDGGQRIELNRAPSEAITDLEFSNDGQRLLCVGLVDRSRKVAFLEEELMVYQRGDGTWKRPLRQDADELGVAAAPEAMVADTIQVRMTIGFRMQDKGSNASSPPGWGVMPYFTNATFSEDGNRILLTANTTNRDQAVEQNSQMHVFDYRTTKPDGEIGAELKQPRFQWLASSSSSGIDVAVFRDGAGTKVVGCQTNRENSTSGLFEWDVPERDVPQFISTNGDDVVPFQRLNGRVRSMKRLGDTLLTGGSDKAVSLWDLTTRKKIGTYQGHSEPVDFCTLVPGDAATRSTLISVVTGVDPEVLKTELAQRADERQSVKVGDGKNQNSPTGIFVAANTKDILVSGDNGHAVLQAGDENIEWEVSAWRNHVLTDDFLFAQSGRDQFLRYDRKTGELKDVLKKLAQQTGERPAEIVKFQVSRDGKIALLETDQKDSEFQVWNLETQTLVKRLPYDFLFADKEELRTLPLVALSPNGKYVVAGKVGFVVWSTDPGVDQPIFNRFGANRDKLWPSKTISNVVFFNNDAGESEFAVSWPEAAKTAASTVKGKPTGRIHVYVSRGQSFDLVGRFRPEITQGGFDTGRNTSEPNTFAGKSINGDRYILVRSSSSLDLLKLAPGVADPGFDNRLWDSYDKVASFENAKFASFSEQNNDVIILNKGNVPPVQRWSLDRQQLKSIEVVGSLQSLFPEFPSLNFDWIAEDADGSIILQSLVRSKLNNIEKVYNTVVLNRDLSIGALRVLANPTVEYAAVSGERVLTKDSSGTLGKWNLVPNQNQVGRASRLIQPNGVIPGFFELCQLSPSGDRLLVTPRGSGTVKVIDPVNGDLIFEVDANSKAMPSAITWSADGTQLAVGFENGEIRVVDIVDNAAQLAASQPSVGVSSIKSLAFAAEGKSLLVIFNGEASQLARVYHPQLLKDAEGVEKAGWSSVVIGYPGGQKQIVAGDISPDGNRVVTGVQSGQLTFWNVSSMADAVTGDPNENLDLQQIEQRELFDLGELTSTIRFVRFITDSSNGQVSIVAADDSGRNEMQVFRTMR